MLFEILDGVPWLRSARHALRLVQALLRDAALYLFVTVAAQCMLGETRG